MRLKKILKLTKDFHIGAVIYLMMMFVVGGSFSWLGLVAVSILTWFPDSDGVPYILLRNRPWVVRSWIRQFPVLGPFLKPILERSHWLIHYPVPYILILGGIVWWVSHSWFYLMAVLVGSIIHFLEDMYAVPGLRLFGPWGRAYRLEKWRIARVDEVERSRFYEKQLEALADKSAWQEIAMRTTDRPDWYSKM